MGKKDLKQPSIESVASAAENREYLEQARKMRERLEAVSPSFCLAKWKMVSLHLTNGRTQSCYHPPAHAIDPEGLAADPGRLHNTEFKVEERRQMRRGERPEGCRYCWNVEDAGGAEPGGHLSDRHYRSSEWWAASELETVRDAGNQGPERFDREVSPAYVEVNFNQACNFKCIYCSPHLSTEWQKEVERHGPYTLEQLRHNDPVSLKEDGLMPLGVPNSENPYVTAFWAWWPRIYPTLKVFRMTGGEPLIDANTWRVLEYVRQKPNPELELGITSNLCPPKGEILDRLIREIRQIENAPGGPALRSFSLYVSCDSVGAQAEYIRTGMNFNLLRRNVRQVLRETDLATVSFVNTFNVLSVPRLREFLAWVLELREEFAFEHQRTGEASRRQRVWFDIPLLTRPAWLNVKLLAGTSWERHLEECIEFMETNVQKEDYRTSFRGFKPYEILKLRRNLAVLRQGFAPEEFRLNHRRFVQYVDELDRRRRTDFPAVFPELADFYNKPD